MIRISAKYIFDLPVHFLIKGEREVSSILADSNGQVLFENIVYGHYSLNIIKDGVTLGEYLFQIKETDDGRR